jgi:hypothetical protein
MMNEILMSEKPNIIKNIFETINYNNIMSRDLKLKYFPQRDESHQILYQNITNFFPNIEYLSLDHCNAIIQENNYQLFLDFLKNNESLIGLVLSNNEISIEIAVKLFAIINEKKNNNIKSINLSNNKLSSMTFDEFIDITNINSKINEKYSELLKSLENINITEINLSNNDLDDEFLINVIIPFIQNNKFIQILNIENNSDIDFNPIYKEIPKINLKELYLANDSDVYTSNSEFLINLSKNKTLKKISFAYDRFDDSFITFLKYTNLEYLFIQISVGIHSFSNNNFEERIKNNFNFNEKLKKLIFMFDDNQKYVLEKNFIDIKFNLYFDLNIIYR